MDRSEIRQAIGRATGCMRKGIATAAGSTSEIRDSMLSGSKGNYKGREIILLTDTDTGKIRRVIDFDGEDKITLNAVVTDATAVADEYEMWEDYQISQVNESINDAIHSVLSEALIGYEDHTSLTREADIAELAIPADFYAIHTVEYATTASVDHSIHDCATVWDELVDADVVASIVDGVLNLVVAAGCGAGDILATSDIISLDISDCDEVRLQVYSTVALSTGDLKLLLDNTALCASAVEAINIPAISANTPTWVTLPLANPASDSAIISVGIKMVVDKGAFTLKVKDIRAQLAASRIWTELLPNQWSIIPGGILKLDATATGMIRLQGYKTASDLTTDASESEIDPEYIISKVSADILLALAGPPDKDTKDRRARAQIMIQEVSRLKRDIRTSLAMNTRFV